METIKIAHLYYDLMNLYGEHGNILSLTHHLEEHKVRVITHYLSIEDDVDFEKYDLFYIGCGNKEAFDLARRNILKYKKEIKKAFTNKKFFLITGNALDLFGKCYHTLEDQDLETLNLLNYESYEGNERIVGEQVYQLKNMPHEIIGFVNRNSIMKFVKEHHLFDVVTGTGYVPHSIVEGVRKNHFYGTYLLGPIFIRNPYFTEYIIEEILKEKGLSYKPFKEETETKAYEEYKKNMLTQ